MTMRDFIIIANVLRDTRPAPRNNTMDSSEWLARGAQAAQWDIVRDALADALQKTNPRFNREHFLAFVNDTTGTVKAKGRRPK